MPLFSLFRNRRAEELEFLARSLKMDFSRSDSMGLVNYLKDFKLYSRGHSRRVYNILRESEIGNDLKTYIFDFRYTVSSGNSSSTYRQTAFFVKTKELGLPQFYMRPEHFFHRVGSWFGIDDIDFEMDPEFSGKYYLTGEDQVIIRETFSEPTRAYFRLNKKWHVEGLNYFLLIYRPNKIIPPAEIKRFYQKGMEIYSLLKEGGFKV
jgi:hypothetical protein